MRAVTFLVVLCYLSVTATAQDGDSPQDNSCMANGAIVSARNVSEILSYPALRGQLYAGNLNCTWLFQCSASAAATVCNGTVAQGRFAGETCAAAYNTVANEAGTAAAQTWCEDVYNCTLVGLDADAQVTVTFTEFGTEHVFDTVQLYDGSNTLATQLTPGPWCWAEPQSGYQIEEGFPAANRECHETLASARVACEQAIDCHGLSARSGVCDGGWVVHHGVSANLVADSSRGASVIMVDRACLHDPGERPSGLSGDLSNFVNDGLATRYTSSGPSLLMRFNTNAMIAALGFKVDYQCGDPPPLVGQCVDDPSFNCRTEAILTDSFCHYQSNLEKCPKTCRVCQVPYEGARPSQYYPNAGWFNISVEGCNTQSEDLPSQFPIPPNDRDNPRDMFSVTCEWNEVTCHAPRTSAECRRKPPNHYALVVSLWMDCSNNYPAFFCTSRTQAEREAGRFYKCKHIYRATVYDWRASKESLPNENRDFEPGATPMEGVYIHKLPLCSQAPECIGQEAMAPLSFPTCCYIEDWNELPEYAQAICPRSAASSCFLERWCSCFLVLLWGIVAQR